MQIEPIASGLLDFEGGAARLIGGRRKSDGKIVFPAPNGAEANLYERVALSDRGSLWSFTVQRFRPKSPPYAGGDDDGSFRPYALGYVELPGEVIVESRIEVDDFDRLHIGMPMRLATRPFQMDGGAEAVIYVFEPDAEGPS